MLQAMVGNLDRDFAPSRFDVSLDDSKISAADKIVYFA
jgi:hypothetical protein